MAAELKGPKPCVTEADEEGWMIVNLSGKCQHRKDNSVLDKWHFTTTADFEVINYYLFYTQRFR